MLAAFAAVRRAHPTALLVIAPRKPERFGEAEALARAEGLRVVRRTELAVDAEPRADVVILDTIGELAHAVSDRDGRLRRRQPGRPRRPQHPRAGRARQADRVRAAHAELRRDRRRRFCASQAAVQVARRRRELAATVVRLIGDPVERARLGAAARALVEANRGAKPRTLDAIAAAAAAARQRAASCGRSGGLGGRICTSGRQRRQPRDGRARQDAASSAHRSRGTAGRRRASGRRFSAAATGGGGPRTASSSSATARTCSRISTAAATSR